MLRTGQRDRAAIYIELDSMSRLINLRNSKVFFWSGVKPVVRHLHTSFGNVSHGGTHFFYPLIRQNPHRWAVRIVGFTYGQIKGVSDGGGRGRSIGSCASLHAHGGALCSVTYSQRKYHYSHICLMADSPAGGCLRCWWCSLFFS